MCGNASVCCVSGSEYVNKHLSDLARTGGKRYSGSIERVVSGALSLFVVDVMNRNGSSAFVRTGHGVWSLNAEVATEVEHEIYERFLDREKSRTRKRRQHSSMRTCDV